jgi:uroporphyrinogen-III synthase
MTLLITRAEPHAAQLAQLLEQSGVETVSVPVMSIEPVTLSGVHRSTLLGLDGFSTVVVVSANAAYWLAEHIDQYWPQLPININWVAIGQATANALMEHIPELPLDAIHVSNGPDSEALLSLSVFQSVSSATLSIKKLSIKILIAKGEGGRELIQQVLSHRGASVTELPLYRRVVNRVEIQRLIHTFQQPLSWVQVASGDSFLNILAMLEGTFTSAELAELPIKWLVPSDRVAQILISHGMPSSAVVGCEGASNDALVSMVCSNRK